MFQILSDSLVVTTYSAHNQFNTDTAETEAQAHELAAEISRKTGHASVHTAGRLIFSYSDGELFTDNRQAA